MMPGLEQVVRRRMEMGNRQMMAPTITGIQEVVPILAVSEVSNPNRNKYKSPNNTKI